MPRRDDGDRLSRDAAWFDDLYSEADRDPGSVPWARMGPHPFVAEWLAEHGSGTGRSALVVASGLGDDAEAAAECGYRVTAFDVSPTALTWCAERFPDSAVEYLPADLLALPASWAGAFDLVIEVYTIQSLVLEQRKEVIDIIASTVASGGTLLVAALARPDEQVPSGPPFPVSRRELSWFEVAGLDEAVFRQEGWEYLAEYRRP